VDGGAGTLIEAARAASEGVTVFLDASAPALIEAVGAVRAPAVANAVALGETGAQALIEAVARAGAGAVLSPRLADRSRVASIDELASILLEGAERSVRAGAAGPFFFDCLAFPVASDPPRWRRSIELVRMLPGGAARALVAIGNVGHGAPSALRPWLRLIYLALALGAGAGALILPVEEPRLVEAARLIDDFRPAADDVDAWLLETARAASRGSWELPRPPASAPQALIEAWALCRA
jgi:hypothetical protein